MIKKLNTRQTDLESLEEARDTLAVSEAQREKINAVMVAIYEQSKDPFLETKRRELTEAVMKQDFVAIDKIRREITAYASRPGYQLSMAKKISKQAGKEQARQFLAEVSRR